jgi:hypothetical protein
VIKYLYVTAEFENSLSFEVSKYPHALLPIGRTDLYVVSSDRTMVCHDSSKKYTEHENKLNKITKLMFHINYHSSFILS